MIIVQKIYFNQMIQQFIFTWVVNKLKQNAHSRFKKLSLLSVYCRISKSDYQCHKYQIPNWHWTCFTYPWIWRRTNIFLGRWERGRPGMYHVLEECTSVTRDDTCPAGNATYPVWDVDVDASLDSKVCDTADFNSL